MIGRAQAPGCTLGTKPASSKAPDWPPILGLGGAWFELEHNACGIDFGTGFGQRLDWMDEATAAVRSMLDGETVNSGDDGRYRLDGLRLNPTPHRDRMPIVIGGSGEKKTLRTAAKYADQWIAFGGGA